MLITIKTIDIEEKCNSFCKKLTYFFVSTVYYNFLSEGIIWRVRAHTHDQIQSSFLQFFLTIKLNLCSNYILRNIICDMQERRTFLIFAGNFSETQWININVLFLCAHAVGMTKHKKNTFVQYNNLKRSNNKNDINNFDIGEGYTRNRLIACVIYQMWARVCVC